VTDKPVIPVAGSVFPNFQSPGPEDYEEKRTDRNLTTLSVTDVCFKPQSGDLCHRQISVHPHGDEPVFTRCGFHLDMRRDCIALLGRNTQKP